LERGLTSAGHPLLVALLGNRDSKDCHASSSLSSTSTATKAMVSKRKKAAKVESVPPSEVASSSSKPLIELDEAEQLRLIEQSGILDRMKKVEVERDPNGVEYVEERLPLAEEILNAVIYIIPTSFLLLMMEM
jgi:hypothetical protein